MTVSGYPVVTGEAVALDVRPATVPSRGVAVLLDLAAQGALWMLITFVAGALAFDPAMDAAIGLVLSIAVLLGYPVAFETLWGGRTPGKAALGLRVVRDDGGPIRFRHALGRGLTGVFLERPGITLGFAALVSMFVSERSKRVGDLIAGTLVVQERVPAQVSAAPLMPPPLAPWASTLDLSRLTDDLALSMRSFLARAPQLDPRAREDLGGRLVAAVTAVVSPPPPLGTPGWAVLAAVLAERRRREELRLHAQVQARVPVAGWHQDGYGAPPAPPAPTYGAPTAHPVPPAPSYDAPPAAGPFAPPG